MKTIQWSVGKVLLLLIALVLAAGGVFGYKLVWGKPFSVDHFYERVFIRFALQDPEMLTQLGILEGTPLRGHNRRLTDVSVERQKAQVDRAIRDMEILRSYSRDRMTEQQRLSADILEWFMDTNLAAREFMFHNFPVNQMFGVQNNLPEFMIETHRIDDQRGAEDYVIRLTRFPEKFGQVIVGLDYRLERDIIPPRFVVDRVLTEMNGFIEPDVESNELYTHLADSLDDLEELSEEDRQAILQGAREALQVDVYPAYRDLIAWFEAVRPQTSEAVGAWTLPDGDRFYRHMLRSNTTTDMSPAEVHELGLEQVDSILSEMDAILREQGYEDGTVGERMDRLAAEDRFLYPDTDAGREQIIADYQAMVDALEKEMSPYFGRLPKASVEVRRVPEFREATAAGAYYRPPPMGGGRPGVFYANLRDVAEVPKFGMHTLAVHEAIPGHHFQIALQMEMEGLPTFRSFPLFSAYTEGWALYAERLVDEMDLYEDNYERLGMLQAQLFRAVRLVVDAGLHYKRWTREEAIDYMFETTGMPRGDVVAEVERYVVMPGQACSYMVGMLHIQSLRDRAEQDLGEHFELSDFHDVVLGNGAMPLSLLSKQVDAWIEASQGD
ncbi:DUF885 domain-containing protein [Gammaproteobacteria bacterium AB-CW1]|uniref:DUF885 domain-containing protein n=1 Tax=Natronospira elongata TaxID=3110268 RepID=A0AAP6MLE7_9GAMM|nr:DUF885 domain-containing protein [Gammaproteobacteria bacterium AB-CW1]